MTPIARDELVIMRHAPADHGGRLCGRTDVAAILPEDEALAPLRLLLNEMRVVTTPARRCQETARALFPDRTFQQDADLWEQDFGVDEGRSFADLPDLGSLSIEALAQYAAPEGESFLDMVERVAPSLHRYEEAVRDTGTILLIAHAGTVRAALGLALGQPALGLKFEIKPLSLTRLRCHEGGLSIVATNERVGP